MLDKCRLAFPAHGHHPKGPGDRPAAVPLLSAIPYRRRRNNPLISIARNAAADMVRDASESGMGPLARSRIAAGISPQPPRRKFDGQLKQP